MGVGRDLRGVRALSEQIILAHGEHRQLKAGPTVANLSGEVMSDRG